MAFPDPLVGVQFGSCRIEHLLGQGGMARVYYAWDTRLERPVAVKVIDDRLRGDAAFRERFLREARAVAAWHHPNILQIYNAGEVSDIPYFTMEYIEGMDLGELLRQYARAGQLMPYADVLVIGRAVASALDYAHRKGVIHRDVKPSNVLISGDDRVVLSDFGLAMIVSQGTQGKVFGSPHYMSPEQARNSAEAVAQSDVYSLGVMLFELLTGSLPFDDPSPTSLALKHIAHPPPSPREINPQLSQEVDAVLLKALGKKPQERYASAGELLDALQKALEDHSVPQTQTQATLPYLPGAQAAAPSLTPQTLAYISQAPRPAGPAQKGLPIATPAWGGAVPPGVPPISPPGRGSAIAPGGTARPALRWMGWGLGCLAVFFAMLLVGLGIAYAVYRQANGGQVAGLHTPTLTPTLNFTSTLPVSGSTAALPALPSSTVHPTGTVSPAPTTTHTEPPAHMYELEIRTQKDDSLFVIFNGPGQFPIRLLELRGKEGQIYGEEWELEWLAPGECVAAWKDSGRAEVPKGLECNLVGERLDFEGPERFWKTKFDVYFAGERLGECNPDKDGCKFTIEHE